MSEDKCPCGENHTRRQHRAAVTTGEVEDMRAEIERLREALKPFAEVWERKRDRVMAELDPDVEIGIPVVLSAWEAARAALGKEGDG